MDTRAVFDRIAARYDTPERAAVAKVIADAMRAALPADARDLDALDYGCGTGLVGLPLAGCFRSMTLVDTAPEMVRITREKIAAMGLMNATAQVGDFLDVVPAGLRVGLVLMAQVLLHVPDTDGMLARIAALLPAGGCLLAVDFVRMEGIENGPAHPGFDMDALARQALADGFASAQARPFYSGDALLMGQPATLFLLHAVK